MPGAFPTVAARLARIFKTKAGVLARPGQKNTVSTRSSYQVPAVVGTGPLQPPALPAGAIEHARVTAPPLSAIENVFLLRDAADTQ